MTLTDKKIQRMVNNYQYIRHVTIGKQTPEEQMTQLYYFLRDQMQDVERADRQEASDARHNNNGYAGKAGH
mgnify:FL=1